MWIFFPGRNGVSWPRFTTCSTPTSAAVRKGALGSNVIKERCQNLVAVFRETLRVGPENSSTRVAKEGMMLADNYFLHRGSVVQTSGSVIHTGEYTWGADVVEFNHKKFLRNEEGKPGVHPAECGAFGGGKSFCPGKHFTTTEVVMLTAMLLVCFDFAAVDGDQIEVPKKNDAVMSVYILEPLREPTKTRVTLMEEAGEAIKWRVVV